MCKLMAVLPIKDDSLALAIPLMAEMLSLASLGNTDGTGIAIQGKETNIAKTAMAGMAWVWSDEFVDFVLKEWDTTSLAIGHVRLASSGTRGKTTTSSTGTQTTFYGKSVAKKNSHPWTIGHITAAHNGHLSNHEAARRKFKMDDVDDIDTDSVVFPWLLDHFSEGKAINPDVIQKAVNEIEGGFAFLVLDDRDPGTIWCIRKENPLHIIDWNGYTLINTDGEIIRRAIDRARGQLRLLYGLDSPPAPTIVEFLPSNCASKITREGFVEKATISFPEKEMVRQYMGTGSTSTISSTMDAASRKKALETLIHGPIPFTRADLEVISIYVIPEFGKKLEDLKDFEFAALVRTIGLTKGLTDKDRGYAIKKIYARYREQTPIKHPDHISMDVARRYGLFVPLGLNDTGVLRAVVDDLPSSIHETWCRRCPKASDTACTQCYLDRMDEEATSLVQDTLDAEFRDAVARDVEDGGGSNGGEGVASGNVFLIPGETKDGGKTEIPSCSGDPLLLPERATP